MEFRNLLTKESNKKYINNNFENKYVIGEMNEINLLESYNTDLGNIDIELNKYLTDDLLCCIKVIIILPNNIIFEDCIDDFTITLGENKIFSQMITNHYLKITNKLISNNIEKINNMVIITLPFWFSTLPENALPLLCLKKTKILFQINCKKNKNSLINVNCYTRNLTEKYKLRYLTNPNQYYIINNKYYYRELSKQTQNYDLFTKINHQLIDIYIFYTKKSVPYKYYDISKNLTIKINNNIYMKAPKQFFLKYIQENYENYIDNVYVCNFVLFPTNYNNHVPTFRNPQKLNLNFDYNKKEEEYELNAIIRYPMILEIQNDKIICKHIYTP